MKARLGRRARREKARHQLARDDTPPLAYCAGCGKPLWAGDEMCPPGCGKEGTVRTLHVCAAPGCEGHDDEVTVPCGD